MEYSKIDNQKGCGYCKYEKKCKYRNPKINKAKSGCKKFKHFSIINK